MARISSYPVVTPKAIDTLIISQGYDIDADEPIEDNPTGSVTIGSVIDLVNTGLVPGTGTVTSLGVSMPSAFTVSNSPVTTTGVINITGSGTSAQYIDGTGSLQSSELILNRDSTTNSLGNKTIPSDFNFSSIPASYANSIWNIVHHHDLGGATVTLPAGVILNFTGGKFSNGTLTGNNTKIKSALVNIFHTNASFNGTWNVKEAYPQWFGAIGDGVQDDTDSIQNAINVSEKVSFQQGVYNLTKALELNKSGFIFEGNGSTLSFQGVVGGGSGSDWYKDEYSIVINGSVSTQKSVVVKGFIFTGVNQWGGIYSTYDYLQQGWAGGVFGVVNETNYTTTREDFLIKDVRFESPFNEAIAFTNTQVIIDNCKVVNGLSGASASPNTGSVMVRATNNVIIQNSYFKGGYGKAVNTSYVDGLKYLNITCILESVLGQTELGLYVGHFNKDTNIVNCNVSGIGNNGKLSYNARNTTVSNCNFLASEYLFIQGSQNTIITGCTIRTSGKRALRTEYHSTWGDLDVVDIVVSGNLISSSETEGDDEDYSLKIIDISNAKNILLSGNIIEGNIYARPTRNAVIKDNVISFTKTGAYVSTRSQNVVYLRDISSGDSKGVVFSGNSVFTENDKVICYFHGDTDVAYLDFSNNIIKAPNLTVYAFTLSYATTGRFVYVGNSYFMPLQAQGEYTRSFSGSFDEKISLEETLFSKVFTLSNVSTDRNFDADSTTISEVADVLGTLINDLKSTGLIH